MRSGHRLHLYIPHDVYDRAQEICAENSTAAGSRGRARKRPEQSLSTYIVAAVRAANAEHRDDDAQLERIGAVTFREAKS